MEEHNFRTYMGGMVFASLPMTMMQVAQGYLAYTMTNSAAALGLVSLLWGIPGLVFTLFGGAVADRYPRRVILIYTQGLNAVLTFSVAFLIHSGMIEYWHLLTFAVLNGTVFAFNVPARQGLIPDVVSPHRIANAIALNNSSFSMLRIVGPSIAGALIAWEQLGVAGVYDVMAISNLLASISLFFMTIHERKSTPSGRRMLGEIAEAIGVIFKSPILSALIWLTLVSVSFGMPFIMLMPVFAVKVFDVGPTGLGTMMAVNGAGALVGSLAIAALSEMRYKARIQIIALVGFGLSLMLLGITPWYGVVLVILLINGALGNVFQALASTLMMTTGDREYLGRIISVNMLLWSFMPMATWPISAVADQIGAPTTVLVLGLILIIATLLVSISNPKFRSHP